MLSTAGRLRMESRLPQYFTRAILGGAEALAIELLDVDLVGISGIPGVIALTRVIEENVADLK